MSASPAAPERFLFTKEPGEMFSGTAGSTAVLEMWDRIYATVSLVNFVFNGFPEAFDGSDLTVQDLLDRTNEDDPAVIVEVNGRFVHRKDFKTFTIKEGDRVEFIHPSFGG